MRKPTKAKTGRKTKFEKKMIEEGYKLAEAGLIDDEMANFWNVTKQTLNNWKKTYPLFFDSLKKGKHVADNKVVRALFQRATGYSHPDTHISSYEGDVIETDIIKHYPPDATSMIFWLCNRKPEEWKSVNRERTQENPNTPVSVDFKFKVVNN